MTGMREFRLDGQVTVGGEVETRGGKKIRGGQRVSCAGVEIDVLA